MFVGLFDCLSCFASPLRNMIGWLSTPHAHLPKGRCRQTRTSDPSDSNEAAGRPIGLLAAWLQFDCACDRPSHRNEFVVYSFDHATRLEARKLVLSLPGGPELCARERFQRDGEDIEPVGWA